MGVVLAIERADDEESSVGFALEFFEFANRIINTELGRFFRVGDDLKVVEANDGSFFSVGTKRLEQGKQFVDRFILKFKDAEIEIVCGEVFDDVFKLNRPGTASNVGSG